MQPEQLLDDAYYAVKELGEKRSRGSYNLCSLLRSVVALGSDWPVVAVNPLGVVRAAVERTPAGWSHPWIPEERIYRVSFCTGHGQFFSSGCYVRWWKYCLPFKALCQTR
ncbi:uncharacterized protein LOC9635356 isoform X3 [Selaginella moellendorffii]|uniref:uncharacterized protein LOC9635356 isoform X3 n=1 Tax=Selaginella moellendorffii TaxID=88036 RepID=UPI000D1C7F02|nr:uncharacterized protein LOC9635356 isoform X3 [Selaginella moellendorffii]|eukprot:XP_024527939.1 uncharacterized protein LOC9635356 isoform X3 [Selaginella moellendorffii]